MMELSLLLLVTQEKFPSSELDICLRLPYTALHRPASRPQINTAVRTTQSMLAEQQFFKQEIGFNEGVLPTFLWGIRKPLEPDIVLISTLHIIILPIKVGYGTGYDINI
ncbi:hypothetical protein WISP_36412 [Willisornis vidua]|uniref:Uncharacterized protein n=1 Tax=Willisornis vidua TaxID=1566151 RepID=A0ABQ9DP54_9PASS|nr:hypothetical protein WISP_36412 [Willisornis vidua]